MKIRITGVSTRDILKRFLSIGWHPNHIIPSLKSLGACLSEEWSPLSTQPDPFWQPVVFHPSRQFSKYSDTSEQIHHSNLLSNGLIIVCCWNLSYDDNLASRRRLNIGVFFKPFFFFFFNCSMQQTSIVYLELNCHQRVLFHCHKLHSSKCGTSDETLPCPVKIMSHPFGIDPKHNKKNHCNITGQTIHLSLFSSHIYILLSFLRATLKSIQT